MKTMKSIILGLTLTVAQLAIINALEYSDGAESQINLEKYDLPKINFSSFDRNDGLASKANSEARIKKSKASHTTEEVIQEIDALTSHINNFTESVIKSKILAIANSKIRKRSLRASELSDKEVDVQKIIDQHYRLYKQLELNMTSITDEVESMKSELIDGSINNRLSNLEEVSERSRKVLDKTIKLVSFHLESPESFANTLIQAMKSIKSEVDKLKKTLDQEKQTKWLQAEIIDDIKSRDFATVAKKLRNLSELEKHINFIVHEVYNNHEGNFYLVLYCANEEGIDATASLAVYEALVFEMESNGHKDYGKILELIRSMEKKFDVNDTSVPARSALVDNLYTGVAKTLENELSSAVKTNNFADVSDMIETIHLKYPQFFQIVIKKAMGELIDEIDIEKLVDFFAKNYHASYSIWVYLALYTEMQSTNSTNRPSMVTLAFALKRALDDKSLDSKSRKEGEELKKSLPLSVKNLAFARQVCIINVNSRQYVYASKDKYKRDRERRRVLSVLGRVPLGGIWLVEQKDDVYLLKNYKYQEYMYAAFNKKGSENSRYVFTWTEKNVDSNQFNWVFEPHGHNVYIRNTDSNEYLQLGELYDNKDERVVYTWIPENGVKTPPDTITDSLWSIKSCNIVK